MTQKRSLSKKTILTLLPAVATLGSSSNELTFTNPTTVELGYQAHIVI